ncbi:MAG: 50S ribosomal protein L3 [Chlamydiae bacterium RIFCSPLOWO2_01_FULL_28_7]|nr:MAG: 50S ribosomal protein L3 [Chlamydiae bacterium RIFCSPLOWO2_01_FULL_28_7]
MSLQFIGKKIGMSQIFDEKGNLIVCTLIEAPNNVVTQLKNKDTDGYKSVQLAAFDKKKPVSNALKGHFAKAKVDPKKKIKESRVEKIEEFTVGQEIAPSYFKKGDEVDVTAVSKGKGFQGLMKLYGFRGMPASHGCSRSHRLGGSTGMRSTPGRCFPGGKRASRMGGDKVTVQNLQVAIVDDSKNLLVIKGSVPGSNNGYVYIQKAKKINK